jgi:hypothetical protein
MKPAINRYVLPLISIPPSPVKETAASVFSARLKLRFYLVMQFNIRYNKIYADVYIITNDIIIYKVDSLNFKYKAAILFYAITEEKR